MSKWTLALSLAAGIAIGATGVQTLMAQNKAPAAYFISETLEVIDAPAFMKTVEEVNAKHLAAGGRYLVLGGKTQSVVGPAPKRITVIAFDSFQQAADWYSSPAYKPYGDRMQQAARARSFIVEGSK